MKQAGKPSKQAPIPKRKNQEETGELQKLLMKARLAKCLYRISCCRPIVDAVAAAEAEKAEKENLRNRPIGRSHDRFLRVITFEGNSTAHTPATSPASSPIKLSKNRRVLGTVSNSVKPTSPEARRISSGSQAEPPHSPRMCW